jgi:flagellar motor switch protein FliN
MTEVPMSAELKAWLETWKTSAQQILSQVAGQAINLAVSDQPLPAADSDVWYTVVSGGVVRGEMALRLPSASGLILAQMLMGEVQPTAADLTAEHKEGLEGLLRQIAGQAATALPSPVGEVQFHLSASSAPTWKPAATVRFESTGESTLPVSVEIHVSAALASALRPQASSAPAPQSAGYERLMDVGLEVSLRFGTRHMELRDVLALSAGVVVELDRSLQAPVDLLLDGRVIAQGEVVVVDGKYGLRVTEVVNPGPAA